MDKCYYLANVNQNVDVGSANRETDKSRFVTILNNYITDNSTGKTEKLREWVMENGKLCFKK